MVTSRTGTAKWRRIRKHVIGEARAAGITHCPGYDNIACGRELDYETYGQPNSVEVDHIIPHADGGEDSYENARVLCFTCNRTRGRGQTAQVPPTEQFPIDPDWLDAILPVTTQ
jgi:5-methylcytosine-specific restriction protein A